MRYILFQLEKSLLGDEKDEKRYEKPKKSFQRKKRKSQVQTWPKFLKELEEKRMREFFDFINLDDFKME